MRAIEIDGLTWGASTLVPLAFGIKKLQVNLVVEDEKVSIDDLQAQIEADEDHVQSTDVVSLTIILPRFFRLMGVLGCYAKAIDVLQILIDSAVKSSCTYLCLMLNVYNGSAN